MRFKFTRTTKKVFAQACKDFIQRFIFLIVVVLLVPYAFEKPNLIKWWLAMIPLLIIILIPIRMSEIKKETNKDSYNEPKTE